MSLGRSGPRRVSTNGTVVWIRNRPIEELSRALTDGLEEAEARILAERPPAEIDVEDDDGGRDDEHRLEPAEERARAPDRAHARRREPVARARIGWVIRFSATTSTVKATE